MNPSMVECPVCGKWLKNFFALNGHMRLKGDVSHDTYVETHKMQIPKKYTTDIEKQLQELISLVKEQSQHQSEQNKFILVALKRVIELLIKPNTQSTMPNIQREVKIEIPEKKGEKTLILAELIKKHGNYENVVENVNYFVILDAIDNDASLSLPKRLELKDIAWKGFIPK